MGGDVMIRDAAAKATAELLYNLLLQCVVLAARLLGKPCPIVTRAERRQSTINGVQS